MRFQQAFETTSALNLAPFRLGVNDVCWGGGVNGVCNAGAKHAGATADARNSNFLFFMLVWVLFVFEKGVRLIYVTFLFQKTHDIL